MKRRILSIALTLCMVLSLVPTTVFAAETYSLYIGSFQFSSTNLTYTSGSGSATYDPGSNTLTVKNLSLSTEGSNTIIQSGIPGLTMRIDGELTLNILPSQVVGDTDYGKLCTNYGIAVTADTTICGANNNVDKDSIIITSQSTGIETVEYTDGTTRVGISVMSDAKLTMENLTVSMTDNSTGDYAGHASMIRAVNALNISGCKLVANKCQFGIFVDALVPVTISNTAFSMALNGEGSSGVNLSPIAENVMRNCSGSISAKYPIYTAGPLTISGGSMQLVAGSRGILSGQNQGYTPGKLIIDDNAQLEIQSENLGLSAEYGGSITMKSGTVTVTKAACGVQVFGDDGIHEDSSFAMQGGTLSIHGADATNCLGIKNKGTLTVTGGSLKTENVYTAIQNDSSTALSVTGGEHTLTAATCGYLGGTSSELKISNTAKVTINAQTGIQLPAESGSKLTVSGGELNINTTDTGINLEDSTSTMTLSGGKVNITDKNASPTITGMVCVGKAVFSGAEVTFRNCKIDLQSRNSNNKMTGGKLHLSGYGSGAQFYFGFEMTGGVIDGSANTFGIVAAQGTTTLKGGTVNLTAGYPFYLTYDGIVDFAGANVTGTSTANCGLYVKSGSETEPDSSSYKISGGTVVLTSTQAGANEMYTSIADGYGVWAGADEASATLVETPTQPILATNKYVRFAEKKALTLTLVNVKEGASASYFPGTSFTYTAKDAPSGKHFSHWELTVGSSTTNVGTGNTYSGRMPAGDATLTAVFENHSYTAEVAESQYLKTEATCTEAAVYYKSCSVCGASSQGTDYEATFSSGEPLTHAWSAWTSTGNNTHSRTCSRDENHKETEACSGGTATCQQKAVCEFCHAEYGELAAHSYTAEVAESQYLKSVATSTEAAVYYKSCSVCGASSHGTAFEATFSHGGPLGNVDVPYLYCDENGANWRTGTKLTSEYTRVTTSNTSWGTSGKTTWYVVQDTVPIDSRVTVSGDVRLILTDGCTLTVTGGIQVQDNSTESTPNSNALTIYAQSVPVLNADGTVADGNRAGMLTARIQGEVDAAIGGNENGDGGTITINGGLGCNGGIVTITGGIVTASCGESAGAGIGAGIDDHGKNQNYNNSSTFRTQEADAVTNGNAVIFASSLIGDQSGKYSWHGVIFEGDNGAVYGDQTLTADLTIPEGKTLTIPAGVTLTIAEGGTLTNNGTLYVDGALSGTMGGNGEVNCRLTVNGGTATPTFNYIGKTYGKAGETVTLTATNIPEGQVLDGWTTSDSAVTVENNAFTMPGKALTVTARLKTIGTVSIDDPSKVYDSQPVSMDGKYTVNGTGTVTVEYKAKDAEDVTYTQIAPTDAGSYTVRISVAASDNYTAAFATQDFTITKAAQDAPKAPTVKS